MAGKGGRRPGAGRPKGSKAVKHIPSISDADKLMPLDWLLAVLRDPLSEAPRRDAIALAIAPYYHPRLNAVATNTEVKGGDTVNNIVNIYAVPRGAALNIKDGTVTIDGGSPTELSPIEPFAGTPALEHTNNPPTGPLPVRDVDTSNVTRLKRPGEPGAMVQRVFDALGKRDTRKASDTSDPSDSGDSSDSMG